MLQKLKLAGYRKMLNLNQEQMAIKLGISRQAYSEKERGKVPFKESEMRLIKSLVKEVNEKVTIDEIFFN
ncbi:helix-turn-helix domain-containing protein [Enterococcus faecium]|nr:helix-turn-helix domain-containing protein [Enterococcus faecium]MDQ8465536.1 helix-turn-helix domain-containing protein [Enterococcus faecium]